MWQWHIKVMEEKEGVRQLRWENAVGPAQLDQSERQRESRWQRAHEHVDGGRWPQQELL